MSSRDVVLYAIIISFTVGIFVRSLTSEVYIGLVLFLVCVVGALSFFKKQILSICILAVITAVSFGLGVLRYELSVPKSSSLINQVGKQISFEGIVVADPDVREFNTKLSVRTGADTILATVPRGVYAYGDRVQITGVLEQPENFQTETGRMFDYVSYLGKDNIYFLVPKASGIVLAHAEASSLLFFLFKCKHRIERVFSTVLPDPERSLMSGILLGTKQSLGEETRDALVTTGTIHIVALSGYNVSVVAAFFMYLLRGIGSPLLATLGGGAGIIFFVLMTGVSSTAVRAGIMAVLVLLAGLWRRPYDSIRILCITGVLMLLSNPRFLTDDISFQLSFLATAGIILIEPIIRSRFSFLKWNWFISLISVTLAAQIAVLPFLVYKMGALSIISLPVNILVLPLVEVVMFLGALTAFIGITIPVLVFPVGYLTDIFLKAILAIIGFGARVPHAAVIVPQFLWIWPVLCYGLIAFFIVRSRLKLTS